MRVELVSVEEMQGFLNVPEGTDQEVLSSLLDQVQTLFESACNRHERPFAKGETRTEIKDGTGIASLYLDYPLAALTSVKLGYDATNPDETLSVTDLTKLVWRVGSERLVRVDGGCFGRLDQPGYIQVVYTSADFFPAPARLAVMRGTAVAYRQRGSEDARAERIGGYSADLTKLLEDQPEWREGVAACWLARI